jgi:hypothetical protein
MGKGDREVLIEKAKFRLKNLMISRNKRNALNKSNNKTFKDRY